MDKKELIEGDIDADGHILSLRIMHTCGIVLYVHTPVGGAWGAYPKEGETNGHAAVETKIPQYWRGTGNLHQCVAGSTE
jgi:hypothetical protein